jgi:hypothetical protein
LRRTRSLDPTTVRVPTDPETILLGRLNSVYGKDAAATPETPRNAIGQHVQ